MPTEPETLSPLLSIGVEPRRCLALFDIADDPEYAALEVQAFADDTHGTGILVLLAHHDGTVDIHRQPQLRLDPRPFAVGRGVAQWREADIDPAVIEVAPDGLRVDVGLEDASGRRVEVHIEDRDGGVRRRSTLLAPVSFGVERPDQLLVVLLREFDLGRTSGDEPRLTIGGVARMSTPFPGPAWLTRRRFIRSSAAPLIVTALRDLDGPVDPASLGPVESVEAVAPDGSGVALRFEPALPALAHLAVGDIRRGRWALDVADERPVFGGRWTAARDGDAIHLALDVTEPWRPTGLPISLRAVTTLARVFRHWPTTYRWTAVVDLAAQPPRATTRWSRTTGPERANAYGLRFRGRAPWVTLAVVASSLAAGVVALRRATGMRVITR
jgi:hypothetical protein